MRGAVMGEAMSGRVGLQTFDIGIGRPIPLPLLRQPVPAGFPSPAEDFIESQIDLQQLLIQNRAATFLVRVDGNSMIEKGLQDGDLAVVNRSLDPRNGDVVVVDVDEDRSFKVCSRNGAQVGLAFANRRFPTYEVPPGADIAVWGVVTATISVGRRFDR